MPGVRVTQLYVYPVKSCAGTALEVAEIGPRGVRHDREFMVVDRDGMFLTQRELPRMALIRPCLEDSVLALDAPEMPPLRLDLPADGPRRQVRVWRDQVIAADQGPEPAEWLSAFLGTDCRLVRLPDDVVRPVDAQFATSSADQVGFSDGFPILLISEESLADLNDRLETPLPMNRFRPNIVVGGWGAPYGEDTWAHAAIGDVRFSLVKACARCAITTTDQATARRGIEPLATLATYRRVPRGVLFGQNLIPTSTGEIAIGNEVVIEAGAQCAARERRE